MMASRQRVSSMSRHGADSQRRKPPDGLLHRQGSHPGRRRRIFDIKPGETVGIVGESGSGKSVTARSIMGLVDSPGRILDGSIRFKGEELTTKSEKEYRQIRGGDIAMVFQDPLTSLNPVYSVGNQIKESLRLHQGLTGTEATKEAINLLEAVGIPDAGRRIREYPHQFSGGMRQRAVIAMALACDPELLICDEPTTALDVTIQAQILELLDELQEERDLAHHVHHARHGRHRGDRRPRERDVRGRNRRECARRGAVRKPDDIPTRRDFFGVDSREQSGLGPTAYHRGRRSDAERTGDLLSVRPSVFRGVRRV